MQLLGVPLSPFVRKARIVAAEKGIDYDFDPSPGPRGWPEGFERINPFKRIPALLPDADNPDFAINDSSAISAYFEKLQPQPALYPADATNYGRALWIEEVSDTDMAAQLGLGVFRPVMFNAFSGKAPDFEEAHKGFDKLAAGVLTYLDAQLAGNDYFAGDFSIADIAVTSQLMNLNMAGFAVPSDKFAGLRAHYERCIARPSIAGFIEQDAKFFAKMGLSIERQID